AAGPGPATGPGTGRAFALCIGVNVLDTAHYGSVPVLSGCVEDAQDIAGIAQLSGFQTRILRNQEATAEEVLRVIHDNAVAMQAGDIFLMHFAGHGSQTDDVPPNKDEPDDLDETLCLFN